jgi:hypothetical protein
MKVDNRITELYSKVLKRRREIERLCKQKIWDQKDYDLRLPEIGWIQDYLEENFNLTSEK